MSPLPILYSFRRCPYAIRARLALLVSKTNCVVREVKLSAKPTELIAISPKASVPVLAFSDGYVLDESLDIMRWALTRHDPAGWLDHVDETLIEANDGSFKHHLDRAKYPDRYGEDPAFHRGACLDLLRPLEEQLERSTRSSSREWNLTDAAIFPFIRQFASINREWFDAQPIPHIRRRLDRFLMSPLFEAAMFRLMPWKAGDPEFHLSGVDVATQLALDQRPSIVAGSHRF